MTHNFFVKRFQSVVNMKSILNFLLLLLTAFVASAKHASFGVSAGDSVFGISRGGGLFGSKSKESATDAAAT